MTRQKIALLESLPRRPSAYELERVVPMAQRVTVDGIMVAIASLEFHGEGLGVLRWWISFGEGVLREDLGFGMPEPEFEVLNDSNRALPWSPREAGYGGGEADSDIEIRDLPDQGALEDRVLRLSSDANLDGEYLENRPSHEGPWAFRFTLWGSVGGCGGRVWNRLVLAARR